jgi:hypothetical protein
MKREPKTQHHSRERNCVDYGQQCLHLPKRWSRNVPKKPNGEKSCRERRGGNDAGEPCKCQTKKYAVEQWATGQVCEHTDEGASRRERDHAGQFPHCPGRGRSAKYFL